MGGFKVSLGLRFGASLCLVCWSCGARVEAWGPVAKVRHQCVWLGPWIREQPTGHEAGLDP